MAVILTFLARLNGDKLSEETTDVGRSYQASAVICFEGEENKKLQNYQVKKHTYLYGNFT